MKLKIQHTVVFPQPVKMNKRGVLISSGGLEKTSGGAFIRHSRVG